jgi:hypothetical protein
LLASSAKKTIGNKKNQAKPKLEVNFPATTALESVIELDFDSEF